MAEMDNKVLLGIFAAIAGCYGWLIKHLMNSKGAVSQKEFTEHKKAVRYKDTCDQIVKRIEERFDSHEKSSQDRRQYEEIQFTEIKQMIKEIKN